jgi:serine/threonine-protein kinase HipA
MPTPVDSTLGQLELYFGQLRLGVLLAAPKTHEREVYALQIDPEFLRHQHEIAPIQYPYLDAFRTGLVEFHEAPDATSPFAGGLPGFVADSLPDKWGALVASHEDPERAASLMGMLDRVGSNGQGAISFRRPGALIQPSSQSEENLASLAERAQLLNKNKVGGKVAATPFSSGGTLGGVFPKTEAFLPVGIRGGGVLAASEILIGGTPPAGHIPCIVKFSPSPDEECQGAVEYAFHTMARAAGLKLPAACLLEDERGGRHFAVERFDRTQLSDGSFYRLHMQSLSALLHRRPVGEIRYGEFLETASFLGGPEGTLEAFRRFVFNILATNRDDHGRNHAFLYDPRTRAWSIAPAYDLNPNVSEALHAIRWGSGSELPTRFEELLKLGEAYGLPRAKCIATYEQINDAIAQWPRFSSDAGVSPEITQAWGEGILRKTKHGGPLRMDAQGFFQRLHQRGKS